MTSINKTLFLLPEKLEPDNIYLVKKETGVELSVTDKNIVSPTAIPMKRILTIQGPKSLFYGEVGTFKITNYGTLPAYTVQSLDGTIVNNGETFTFVCSDTNKAIAYINVSGRVFAITMKVVKPKPPVIQSPTENSTPLVSGLTLSSGPFSLNYSGASDTHLSTDWEISTDPNFTTIVKSSYNDTVNKITYTP